MSPPGRTYRAHRIYLDHNASAPLVHSAVDAMREWLDTGAPANASSTHHDGRVARQHVTQARLAVARALGIADRLAERTLIFCGSATEANALAIASAGGPWVTSAAEHPSVMTPGRASGATIVPVDTLGRIDLGALEQALVGARLCSFHLANNETGTIQDAAAIAERCAAAGVRLHLDASQAFGRLPLVDIVPLVDYLTLSSHKIGGPHGVGVLYARSGAPVSPLLSGGHQERGRRAGTENVLALVGFAAAVRALPARIEAMVAVAARRDRLWEGIVGECSALAPVVVCRLGAPDGLPNTLSVHFGGLEAEGIVMALDLEGVSVSTGSACTSGSVEPSHVLLAMGLDDTAARQVVRFSLGPETTDDEIVEAITRLARVLARQTGGLARPSGVLARQRSGLAPRQNVGGSHE